MEGTSLAEIRKQMHSGVLLAYLSLKSLAYMAWFYVAYTISFKFNSEIPFLRNSTRV